MKPAKYIVCDDKQILMVYTKHHGGGQFTYSEGSSIKTYTKKQAQDFIALTNKWRKEHDYPIYVKYKLILVK